MPMSRAVRLCPDRWSSCAPDFKKYRAVSQQVLAIYRAVTPLVEPLSLDEAYLDVTENAWSEPLGMTRREAAEEEHPRDDRTHGVGRRGAEQVPREDRVRMEEARRPDGDRAGARRIVPAGTAGRCALGRRTGDRQETARAGYRQTDRRPRRRSRDCCARRWAASPTGCSTWRDGEDDRAVVAEARGEVVRQREHLRAGSDRLTDIRDEIDAMARDVAAWLVKKERCTRGR